MSESLWWAYGVLPAASSPPDRATGVEGARVELIKEGALAALASPVPPDRFSREALEERLNDLTTLEQLARTHEMVLEAALGAADVVPFPICTVYRTSDAIREMLAADSARFQEALARVRGKEEWGVKAFALPREDGEASEQASSGSEYLARRLAQRKAEAASTDALERAAAELHARLAERASAAVLTRLQDRRLSGRDEPMVLNAAYLVARQEADEFARLVKALDRRESLALEITGPWPAYHFTGGAA